VGGLVGGLVSVVQLRPGWHSGNFLDRTRSEADAAATDRAIEQAIEEAALHGWK